MKAKKIKEEIPGKSKTSCLIHLSFVEVKLRKKILPIQSVMIDLAFTRALPSAVWKPSL